MSNDVFSIPVTIQQGQCSPSLAPSPDTAEHWPIFDTTLVSLEDSGIKTFITKSSYITLKPKNFHNANFVVTDGRGGCRHSPTCSVTSDDKVGIMTTVGFQHTAWFWQTHSNIATLNMFIHMAHHKD